RIGRRAAGRQVDAAVVGIAVIAVEPVDPHGSPGAQRRFRSGGGFPRVGGSQAAGSEARREPRVGCSLRNTRGAADRVEPGEEPGEGIVLREELAGGLAYVAVEAGAAVCPEELADRARRGGRIGQVVVQLRDVLPVTAVEDDPAVAARIEMDAQ